MIKKYKRSDFFIGVIFSVFFISLGLIIVINFKPLYYFDIDYLNIVETSGFDKDAILLNYTALIDYCSPFFQGSLQFPTFKISSNALQHFAEVKTIFNAFYILGLISFVLLIMIIIYKYKKKDNSYLFVSSIISILLPVVVGVACAINFDAAFVLFHKIFFRNDYWMFDPYQDHVINILPGAYFLHCTIFIILIVLIGSLSLFLLSRKQQNR